jgi:ABC-2 type transport system permease protein
MMGGRLRPLVRRSLARGVRVFAVVAGILAGFQVLLVLIATTFQTTRSFDLLSGLMPLSVQQSFGPGALMLASFAGMVTFGYFHPIVVIAVLQLGVWAATEPAGEIEWGLFDLELARPVRRATIVARSLVVAFGVTAAMVAAMACGTWAGLTAFAPDGVPWPDPLRVLSLAAHLLMLSWVFAAAGLAASAFARRRGSAFGAVLVATVFLDLLNVVADSWKPAAGLRPYSPFHYYPGFAVASGTAPVAQDLAVLAALAAVLILIAFWRFERRDL